MCLLSLSLFGLVIRFQTKPSTSKTDQPSFGNGQGKRFKRIEPTRCKPLSIATGAAINGSFIMGLNGPVGLAVSGNKLFLADFLNGTVGEYDAKTGAAINDSFITGLTNPSGLAVKTAK